MGRPTVRLYVRNEDGELDGSFQPVEITYTKGAEAIPLSITQGERVYEVVEIFKSENYITKDPDYFCYYTPK
jgi:hypothetical protein